MNQYKIYFQRYGETAYVLPVNPETFPTARETENGEYNVLGIGAIMIPRIPKQKTVSISSFFPGRPLSYMITGARGFVEPAEFISFFESVMKNREVIVFQPVRYYENGDPFSGGDEDGFPVLITSFHTEERGGETGDFYYTLELTEYRDYTPKELRFDTQSNSQTGLVATVEPSRDIPQGQIVVGSVCVCNGRYYNSSYGDTPFGNGNGRRVTVARIVDLSRAFPYHIKLENGGPLGWTAADSLAVVS